MATATMRPLFPSKRKRPVSITGRLVSWSNRDCLVARAPPATARVGGRKEELEAELRGGQRHSPIIGPGSAPVKDLSLTNQCPRSSFAARAACAEAVWPPRSGGFAGGAP